MKNQNYPSSIGILFSGEFIVDYMKTQFTILKIVISSSSHLVLWYTRLSPLTIACVTMTFAIVYDAKTFVGWTFQWKFRPSIRNNGLCLFLVRFSTLTLCLG